MRRHYNINKSEMECVLTETEWEEMNQKLGELRAINDKQGAALRERDEEIKALKAKNQECFSKILTRDCIIAQQKHEIEEEKAYNVRERIELNDAHKRIDDLKQRLDDARAEFFTEGSEFTWKNAQRIVNMSEEELDEIFDEDYAEDVIQSWLAEDAIAAIAAHDAFQEKQRQEMARDAAVHDTFSKFSDELRALFLRMGNDLKTLDQQLVEVRVEPKDRNGQYNDDAVSIHIKTRAK